jgi:hypothetical protein
VARAVSGRGAERTRQGPTRKLAAQRSVYRADGAERRSAGNLDQLDRRLPKAHRRAAALVATSTPAEQPERKCEAGVECWAKRKFPASFHHGVDANTASRTTPSSPGRSDHESPGVQPYQTQKLGRYWEVSEQVSRRPAPCLRRFLFIASARPRRARRPCRRFELTGCG